MAKKGRPVVYESDDERPTTISVRVPHAMYARLERHVRLYRHSMTDLLLQGLAWRRQASSLFSPKAFARPLSSDI